MSEPTMAPAPRTGLVRAMLLTVIAVAVFVAGVLAAGPLTRKSVADATREPPVKSVELVELIGQVKTGLTDAERATKAKGELALFKLDSFDLEVNVVARASTANNIKLFTVGSEITTGQEKVQKIHLRWTADPEKRDGVTMATPLSHEESAQFEREIGDADKP